MFGVGSPQQGSEGVMDGDSLVVADKSRVD